MSSNSDRIKISYENLVLKIITSNCGDRIDKLLEHPKVARHQKLRICADRINFGSGIMHEYTLKI